MSRHTKAVVRWLIFCFPAGLLMMWSDKCRWPRVAKSLVSLGFACAVIAVLLPATLPPERAKGGVQLVSAEGAVELQGPVQASEDAGKYEVYVDPAIKRPTTVIEPTPTPTPIYVYCNTGGKYYHSKNCRYFKTGSARVTLSQALDAGFGQCKTCDAPAESLG